MSTFFFFFFLRYENDFLLHYLHFLLLRPGQPANVRYVLRIYGKDLLYEETTDICLD